MASPFKNLGKPQTVEYDEWGGQFSCSEIINGRPCNGYAKIAKYIKKEKILTWVCQDGHISKLENVDE